MDMIRQIARLISEDAEPESSDTDGGIPPHDERERRRYAHADLITLPEDVEGTNCGNCKYAQESGEKESGFVCAHGDLRGIEITPRMCCKYWDHEGVKLSWTPKE